MNPESTPDEERGKHKRKKKRNRKYFPDDSSDDELAQQGQCHVSSDESDESGSINIKLSTPPKLPAILSKSNNFREPVSKKRIITNGKFLVDFGLIESFMSSFHNSNMSPRPIADPPALQNTTPISKTARRGGMDDNHRTTPASATMSPLPMLDASPRRSSGM